MIAEAVDTARTLALALLVWIAVGSAVATAVVYAAGVWWAWRGLSGAVRAAGALRALRALPESPDASQGHTGLFIEKEAA